MAVRGITFDEQAVTAKNDGTLYESILTNGILNGCGITFNGTTVTIAPGYFIVKGRVCRLADNETVLTNPLYSDGYARIRLVVDLSKAASADEFEQVYFEVDYSATDSFETLTEDDINSASGVLYETEFAVLRYDGGSLLSIVRAFGPVSIIGAEPEIELTPNRAVISNAEGKLEASSNVTATEIGYLDGVTSNIQTQISTAQTTADGKVDKTGSTMTGVLTMGNLGASSVRFVKFDGGYYQIFAGSDDLLHIMINNANGTWVNTSLVFDNIGGVATNSTNRAGHVLRNQSIRNSDWTEATSNMINFVRK